MVFRLISEGRTTHAEIDGKDLGANVVAIYYSHDVRLNGKKRPVLRIAFEDGTEYDSSKDSELPEYEHEHFSYEKSERLIIEAGKKGDLPDFWHGADW